MNKVCTMVAITFLIAGCGNMRMYEGPKLERTEAALLFIHERMNMEFKEVDSKPVNFFPDGKVLEFQPGKHEFVVRLTTFQLMNTGVIEYSSASYDVGYYRLKLDMQAGYTYALNFHEVYANTLPSTLCFDGEPHDAPGSSVNITGEYRSMSDSAVEYACAEAFNVEKIVRKK